MSRKASVDYQRFITLGGADLYAYMEPLVADPTVSVSEELLGRLLSELPTYDEYHLVYALQLGADHSPRTFVPQVAQYLAHERDAVFCTALNILDRLSAEHITQDLVDSVARVLSSCPKRKSFVDVLHRLAQRMGEKKAAVKE